MTNAWESTDANAARSRIAAVAEVWFQSRLSQVEAVKWALNLLLHPINQSQSFTADILEAIKFRASEDRGLSDRDRVVWFKLAEVARHRATPRPGLSYQVHQLRQSDTKNELAPSTIGILIAATTPTLDVEERISFDEFEPTHVHQIPRWMMRANGTVGDSATVQVFNIVRRTTDVPGLFDLFRQAVSVIELRLAETRDIGWFDGIRDIANMTVERVWWRRHDDDALADEADGDDRDPDHYGNGFAPITRLAMEALSRLFVLDAALGRRAQDSLARRDEFLLQRMYAASLVEFSHDPEAAGAFLESIPDRTFWNRWRCPEVSELRPKFFDLIAQRQRSRVSTRLVDGIKDQAFAESYGADAVLFVEDIERARVVDNCAKAPARLKRMVAKRRFLDLEFPKNVPAVEIRTPIRVREAPAGDPTPFVGLRGDALLSALEAADEVDRFDGGRDALALAAADPGTLFDALKATAAISGMYPVKPWDYLLRSIDHGAKEWWTSDTVQELAGVLMGMDEHETRGLFRRIAYFGRYLETKFEDTELSRQLWMKLFPFADESAREGDEGDAGRIASAGLNSSLGYLIQIFFRWSPRKAKVGHPLLWPQPLEGALKRMVGRSKLILSYHLIQRLNFMAAADRTWLDDAVLRPMHEDTELASKLWDLFSLYAPFPHAFLWGDIEPEIIRRIADAKLSSTHRSRLAQMGVIAWDEHRHSGAQEGRKDSPTYVYTLNSGSLRNALAQSTNAVRAAAAGGAERLRSLQEARLSPRKREDWWDDVAEPFLDEVWPLEPSAQSGQSAHVFAEWPAMAGATRYTRAVERVLPFMREFDVWEVTSTFGVSEDTGDLQVQFPLPTLSMIARCVQPNSARKIYGLRQLLDRMAAAHPAITVTVEYRHLERFA